MKPEASSRPLELIDLHPPAETFCADVRRGLTSPRRKLPPKYFYDDRGAELFERITRLAEYYPTRVEARIFERHLPEMAAQIGRRARVIEFGSGSGIKTRTLLSHLEDPVAYIPIDIARAQLLVAAARIADEFTGLDVHPVCADYTSELLLPRTADAARTVAFFPGSTIGNFEYAQARAFLAHVARICGPDGMLLIGADMHKDTDVLELAYNDREGVTAEFNLGLLDRMNRECGTNFDRADFRHRAIYDVDRQRIEMRIVCTHDTVVTLPAFDDGSDTEIRFAATDFIVTEYSHKYTPESFAGLVAPAGWSVVERWTDEQDWFSVWLLRLD